MSRRTWWWRRPRPRREEGRQGQEGGAPPRRLLPAPARLQVLRGEDRLHQLQGRAAALAVHPGAGQDPAAPDFRHLRQAPALAAGRDRARAAARAHSVRDGLGVRTWKSFSENTSSTWARAATSSRSRPGYGRNYLLPRKLALAVTENNKRQIEREKKLAEARDLEDKSRGRGGRGAAGRARRRDRRAASARTTPSTDRSPRPTSRRRSRTKGFEIDKRKIALPDPLKALGETTVPVKIHREVVAQVKVKVVADRK